MKPGERRETGEQDLFRSRLDQIINLNHELVKLAKTISWGFIESKCGEVYAVGPGMPPLPTRLMAGLAILKHTFDLSTRTCARAGSRTRISSSSAARRSSATNCPSTVPR
jgi:IS5 family transposase